MSAILRCRTGFEPALDYGGGQHQGGPYTATKIGNPRDLEESVSQDAQAPINNMIEHITRSGHETHKAHRSQSHNMNVHPIAGSIMKPGSAPQTPAPAWLVGV